MGKRARAVAVEEDWPIGADLRHELGECRQHVAISKIERLARGGLARQERPERRLAIARRPDVAGLVARARLLAQEQFGALVRLLIVERRVPARAIEIRGRVA